MKAVCSRCIQRTANILMITPVPPRQRTWSSKPPVKTRNQPKGPETNYGLDKPGKGIHEVGTVRMGDDPKKAPLNKWGQANDCKNLFVTDGSVFTQQSEKNPTLTILALSMRATEYLIQQKKQLNI